MPEYETAIVCERGHVIDAHRSLTEKHGDAGPPDAFCSRCGAETLSGCPNCARELRGAERFIMSWSEFERPHPYCHGCGDPLPWTEKAIAAIAELAEEDSSLNAAELTQLGKAVERLGDEQESAETTLAVSRFQRITAKLGGPARDAVVKIATDIASAAIRGQIGM